MARMSAAEARETVTAYLRSCGWKQLSAGTKNTYLLNPTNPDRRAKISRTHITFQHRIRQDFDGKTFTEWTNGANAAQPLRRYCQRLVGRAA